MRKIILISILLLSPLFSAVIQTELKNGLWQLVSFKGNHLSDSSTSYQEDITREIIDIADENTTYLTKESDNDNAQLAYIRADYSLSTSFISSTTKLRSSIGLFAIKDSLSPSGKTTLKTNLGSAVKIKIKDAKLYKPNIPRYRMYIKGKTHPILRIDYQANYEGNSFRIKFGNEVEDYIAYFDYTKTFSNAVSLQEFSNLNTDASSYSADIRDIIDFNANDNNLSEMIFQNKFETKDSSGIYNKKLRDYKYNDGYLISAYKLDNGIWKIFNSKNEESSNNFRKLDVAKGYWIKIDNIISNLDDNLTQTALISKGSYDISGDAYKNIKNGWNMLSFNDSYIRYAPTSVFIPMDLISTASFGGVGIYAKTYANTDDRDIIYLTSSYSKASDASRIINTISQLKQDIYGTTHKLRSTPAIKVDIDGNEINGIIVISDELFELNTSGNTSSIITTIAGEALKKLDNNNYRTIYGEYLNFMEINDLSGSDINATVSFKMPKYNSSLKVSSNLNDDNNTVVLMRSLEALRQSATKNGESTPSTRVAGYLTTLNFNITDDYTKEVNMTHMMLASGGRYYISDSTYNRVYKFNRNGKFKISSSSANINIDSGSSTNISDLINTINARTNQTGIVATSLGLNSDGDTQFTISSTSKGLELLENDSLNLFEDIPLTSTSISNANFTRGAITSVSTFLDLLNSVVFNRGSIDGIGDGLVINSTNSSDGSVVVIPDAGSFHDLFNTTNKVDFGGDLNLSGSLTVKSGDELTVGGNLRIAGGLVIRGGARVSVGGDLNISGEIVVNSGGVLIVKRNGRINGNVVVNSGGHITVVGTLSSGAVISADTLSRINKGSVFITSTTSTSSSSVSLLETNVSGIPVGLFDLKGQDFPSITNDLRSNPIPTLDFPISGGIIETLYKHDKKINTIMTMEYSSSNKGFWKITDLTKDIGTLYGNSYDSDNEFNNDYQGIFHLHANKAYWANIDSVTISRPPDIRNAIVLNDSKLTTKSYTHFSNTFNKSTSTTQNHINHRLNIKFRDDVNFISNSGEGKDYYNVVAIIKGQRYYLKRNGAYFSLDINDNDMPLLEKVVNENNIQEKDEAIILEAYDGSGVALKESNNQSHFKIKYFKPPAPTFTWNEDNDLIVDDKSQRDIDSNISKLELYARSVSDIKSQRDKYLLTENNLSKNKDNLLKWEYDNNRSLYGGLSAIRAIIKKYDIKKEVSFYSDMRAFLYAPIKRGHILEANSTNRITNNPYSYISNSKLNKDNGVQISYINKATDINNLSMSYYPQGKEGVKSLQGTGFGASNTMFLRVDTGATNKDAIASIKYIPEYIGKIFYIYFDSKLYQGRFADDDRFSNDGSAYNLESATISVDTFTNGSGSQADGDGGRVVDGSGQGI